ncbi:tetratricopeptide repeat protein [candidate division KSB1 bacterium]|nr:tetratricopeptide repeat protein [candidate division KSB1 bacterium]
MESIDHYKIVGKIGSGGMGVVYKAFDTQLERDVAIKIMHQHLLDHHQNADRFLSEARAAAKLVHPNIVTIYEIGKASIGRYIVMEYVEGQSLLGLMREAVILKPARAAQIVSNILMGLQAAHQTGIWHRDIKPDNILITSDDAIKILDFGIAKISTTQGFTIGGDILGTIEYMPPEQMLGDPVDQTCDLYATGVLFYQMVTGKLPFNGNSPVEILFKKLNEPPVHPIYLNHDISNDLNNVIIRALAPLKGDRWEQADAFARAISAAIDSQSANIRIPLKTTETETDSQESLPNESTVKTIFVGREQEYRKLLAIYRRMTRHHGQTVFLKGEAGIGKTSLALHFIDDISANNSFVLYGESLYQEGMDSYHPYIEALRKFFNKDSYSLNEQKRLFLKQLLQDNVPQFKELTERFNTVFPGQVNSNEHAASVQHGNIIEGIFHFITELAKIQPVVFIIDDIQWADESSLRLFHYIARNIANHRILLIGISRTDRFDLHIDGKPGKLLEIQSRMRRENLSTDIELERLSREHCLELIDRSLQPTFFSEEFYSLIYEETKGNPFFVVETLKELKDNGGIYVQEGIWYDKAEEISLEVPHRVEDIFLRRLSSLTEQESEMLQVASVLGYQFDVTLLSSLINQPKLTVLKTLQRIEQELQIILSTDKGYQFEHPMLQDLIFDQIPSLLRKEYHLMAGKELEKTFGHDSGVHLGDMAEHYLKGGDLRKALPLLYRAGDRAYQLDAFREASVYFEEMLNCNTQLNEPLPDFISEEELYSQLGRCFEQIGKWEQSLIYYQKWADLNENQNRKKELMSVLFQLGRIYDKLSNWDTAMEQYNRCLSIAIELADLKLQYQIFNNIGLILFQQGEYDQALAYLTKTIELTSDENSTIPERAHALTNIGTINSIRGNFRRALHNYKLALEIYTHHNDNKGIARIHHNNGMAYMDMEQPEKAIHEFEQCLELVDRKENLPLYTLTLLNMGKCHAHQKDFYKAYNFVSQALNLYRRINDILSIAEAYHIYGIIYTEENNFDEAIQYLDKSIAINQEKQYHEGLAENYYQYGLLYMKQQHHEKAYQFFEQAHALYKQLKISQKLEMVNELMEQTRVNESTNAGPTHFRGDVL